MFYQNATQVSAYAKLLANALKSSGLNVSRGQALDLIAKTRGFSDWNGYSASLSEAAVDKSLADFEIGHAFDAADADIRCEETGEGGYGPESTLQAHTGFLLKAPAFPADCDYVRVCDPLGREIMYWVADEWAQDPACVMGAIFGALCRGKSLTKIGLVPQPSKKGAAEKAKVLAKVPLITDVDFFSAHAVTFNGNCYQIDWREEAYLADLDAWSALSADERVDCGDNVALRLTCNDEDGFAREEYLTVAALAQLHWDVKQRCFVNGEGASYEFFVEASFADSFERGSPALADALPAADQSMEGNGGYKLYRYWDAEKMIDTLYAAKTKAEAFSKVRNAQPSERLVGESEVVEADDLPFGPYIVEVNGGYYNEFPSLKQACNVAKGLLAADDSLDEAHVVTEKGDALVTFEA